jgi:capsular polysaccharide biosynthesis protein
MLDSVYSLGYQQYRPDTKINTLSGGLFGLMVGCVVVFFLEWLTQGIKRTSNDVERTLDVLVLGQIPPHTGYTPSATTPEGRTKLVPELRGTH